MEEVIKIFYKLQNTSSLNEKKLIIKQHKDNELFKFCLCFLLDGNLNTGLSVKKIKKKIKMKYDIPIFSGFKEAAEYITKHNSGNDMNISAIQAFINSQPEQHKEFYEQMFTKKFRLGCNSKVVNACIPGLIPTFNVQLGTAIEKCKLNGNEYIYISRKLNGSRTAFIGNKCMTRQGKEYSGIEHIISDLQHLVGKDYFVDGELLYKNEEGLTDSESFQKGVGIAMSKDMDKSCLKMVVFDMFPLNEFWMGKSKKKYSDRKKDLESLRKKIKQLGITNVDVVPMVYEGTDHSEIWKWLQYAEEFDWEGVVVNLDAPYECKRTKNLIKVKQFKEIDLRCIGVNIAESGKYKGVMGSITCKYKNFTVDVGSGFNDENRKFYKDNPNEIIGHIVTVKYKEETYSKSGEESLQHPVFIVCRSFDDKNIADDEIEKE